VRGRSRGEGGGKVAGGETGRRQQSSVESTGGRISVVAVDGLTSLT
jgi:hypothetical protein